MSSYTVLSLFSGGGGLDLGFEDQVFSHIQAMDLDPWAVATLRKNRPTWDVVQADITEYDPPHVQPDVLLAGFPCQGFSLGGHRNHHDERNQLYKHVIRISRELRPRIVVIENVLNLRTMIAPDTGVPFAEQIAGELAAAGYQVRYGVHKVCHFGVPQTRRRFLFLGFLGGQPDGYQLPVADRPTTTIRHFLYDLGQGGGLDLPNHDPEWGFRTSVHEATGLSFDPSEEAVPVRFSRTASDGNPVRDFDSPFPAVDTGTIWGWAQGDVSAARYAKDRATGLFVRNPNANVTLWRVRASRLRPFTTREYARLQTFPDDWEFVGKSRRDTQLLVGNAVPVAFAERIAKNVRAALDAMTAGKPFYEPDEGDSYQQLLLA